MVGVEGLFQACRARAGKAALHSWAGMRKGVEIDAWDAVVVENREGTSGGLLADDRLHCSGRPGYTPVREARLHTSQGGPATHQSGRPD